MSTLRPLQIRSAIFFVLLSLLISTFFLAHAQNGQIVIEKYDWPKEPVSVVSMQVGAERVWLGQSFQTNEDWVDNLRVTVKNTSGKGIKYLQLSLRFQSTDIEKAGYIFFLDWPEPLQPDAQGRPEYSNQVLHAGEEATLSTGITMARARQGMARLNRTVNFRSARLDITMADFNDNTYWMGGSTIATIQTTQANQSRL